jgi:long-chain acyl-CoA synthetase
MGEKGKEALTAQELDTLPKLLWANYRENPSLVAMRKKDLGIWNPLTWEDCYHSVKNFALGLHLLGFGPGERLSIVGDNDPQWYFAELAAQALGGAAVGLYIDVIPSEVQYIVDHSDSTFAVAKDQEQCDKLLEVLEKLPKLKKIIYWDPKGMRSYGSIPQIISFEEVVDLGRRHEREHPGLFEEMLSVGKGRDTAVLCYTSGTTGLPKGALISHDFLIKGARKFALVKPWQPTDEYLSFVPLAWIAEQLFMVGWLLWKTKVNYPESTETIQENIREIGPHFLLLGPRQWQGLVSMVQMKMNDAGLLRRWVYKLSMGIGYRVSHYRFEKRQTPPVFWRLLHKLADHSCLLHIRDQLGLRRARTGLTGGSSLGPDVFRWFQAIGVNIGEAYGLTEVNPVAMHREWAKAGTVGPPVPGVEVKISEEGEVWIRSEVIFDGYHKQPEETAKIVQDGWVKTGDAGLFDQNGHLIILDRMKDMLTLRGGEKYSPTYIENRLKFSPYIKDAMVVGGEKRDFLFAIINMDFDNVGRWAEKNGISYTTFVDLSQKKEVYELIQKDVERVNKDLPLKARVKKFSLLHKEFDPDEGELTKTRKLRRAFLENRYKAMIQAAYAGEEKVVTEAEVKYRDGRTAAVSTEIRIWGAQ